MKLEKLKYTLANKIKMAFNNMENNKNNCRLMTNLMLLVHTENNKWPKL
jgi:hypothetical protein